MNYPNRIIPPELSQRWKDTDGKIRSAVAPSPLDTAERIRLHNTRGVFITLLSCQRENIFGEILDGRIELNKFGQIAKQQWENLPCRFPHIDLDEFVIMPNHIHGIIIISTGGG